MLLFYFVALLCKWLQGCSPQGHDLGLKSIQDRFFVILVLTSKALVLVMMVGVLVLS